MSYIPLSMSTRICLGRRRHAVHGCTRTLDQVSGEQHEQAARLWGLEAGMSPLPFDLTQSGRECEGVA